jgi:uncharacterized protein DUF262
MRPAKTKIKKFRQTTKYVHHRSEGLTRRQNAGTKLLVIDRPLPPFRNQQGESGMTVSGTDSETLERLLEAVHSGRIRIPEFQRTLNLQVDWTISLLASVSLDYPIGAVTLLRTDGQELPFTSRTVPGAPAANGRPEMLLIDGQYRLTALYQALWQGGDHSYHLDIDAARDPRVDRDRAIVELPVGEPARSELFPLRRVFGTEMHSEILRGFREYVVPIIVLSMDTARWTVRVHGGPNGPELSERFFGGPAGLPGPTAWPVS